MDTVTQAQLIKKFFVKEQFLRCASNETMHSINVWQYCLHSTSQIMYVCLLSNTVCMAIDWAFSLRRRADGSWNTFTHSSLFSPVWRFKVIPTCQHILYQTCGLDIQ